ncbi:OmpA family protein [Polaribacter batillariae]|uniref:OmpA family protein n=1 Tax=Polaribacter batillariae TaxID=2808900 RepID=A0ABX7T0C8_9FLAO|nr:OmpA family protein [Polaribacter batillariae]QTD38716.1 OmpA family protein [Polaribacter batillariae]
MRRIFLIAILSCFTTTTIFGQFTTDEITYRKRIDLNNSNSWAVGGGISNFIMHGDLRSIGSGDDTNYFNVGAYAYLDKMFNPLLGLEIKAFYTQMSGGAQYFSTTDAYRVLYTEDNVVLQDNMYFKGNAYGAELNLIFSFTNLYHTTATKWHAAGYFGIGYHQYDSALFEREANGPDELLVDFGRNPARNSVNQASSIYLSAQFGLKRRINKRLDLEFRTGMYFNYEDHLDAAISNKQDWETFFVSSIGVTVKLGKKKIFTIWGEEDDESKGKFKIIDTDKDGVMDELDIEPNTPAGVMVYGNGKAVDSDKDGLPDYKDKCPLEYGPESNEGCPLNVDTDGDGVMDGKDLCPNTPGVVENRGCPKQDKAEPTNVTQQIGLLAASIYFDTNSDKIKNISFATIDKIIALMKKVPDVKFVIEGHTDDRNSDRYNLYLSQRRANAVKKYMIQQGISSNNLESKGYGESRPKFSNDNPGGRQLNRRVEIKPVGSTD